MISIDWMLAILSLERGFTCLRIFRTRLLAFPWVGHLHLRPFHRVQTTFWILQRMRTSRNLMIPSLETSYPTVAAFTASTFKEFCRLGEIITRICTLMYSNSTSSLSLKLPAKLETELRTWYASIPGHLKITELENSRSARRRMFFR